MLTVRIAKALALAVEAHDGQKRKGTNIPYVAHPMAVAAIALDYGATEDQAIAALLHDVLEDGGAHYAPVIREALARPYWRSSRDALTASRTRREKGRLAGAQAALP